MRRSRSRRFLSLLAILSLVLAACGTSGTDESTGTTGEAPDTASSGDTAPSTTNAGTDATSPGGGTTVSLSTWMYDEPGIGDFWKLSIEAYEEATGNKVEVRNLPVNQYMEQLVVEMAAGNPADIVFVSANLPEIAAIGQLEPLGQFLEDAGLLDRLGDAAIDFVTHGGEIVAFPVAGRTLDLLYNEELFEEAGLSGPPTTPEEFLEYARELTIKEGDRVVQYGASMVNAQESPTYEMLLMWTIAFGGRLAEDGRPTVNSPAAVQALEFMKQLYDEELIPRGAPEDDQRAFFANGTSAMELDGNWQLAFVESVSPERAEKIRVAPVPWDGPATGGPNQLVAISANSPNKEAALEYIRVLASDDVLPRFTEFSTTIPLLEGVVDEATLEANPHIRPAVEAIGSAVPIAPDGLEDRASEFESIVIEAIVSSLQGGVDPQEALDAAQAELESALG